MHALVVALFLAAAGPAGAETHVSGFNPRFGTAPKNPGQADDRPRRAHSYYIGVEAQRRSRHPGPRGPRFKPAPRDHVFHRGRHRVSERFRWK